MGPVCCPETPIRNPHYSLSNNPEERSSQRMVGLRGYVTPSVTASAVPLLVPGLSRSYKNDNLKKEPVIMFQIHT